MSNCPKYMDVVITSEEYHKGYVGALAELVRIIDDNNITDINKLKDLIFFALDKMVKK